MHFLIIIFNFKSTNKTIICFSIQKQTTLKFFTGTVVLAITLKNYDKFNT